jgi:uncharacterized membrane protein
MFWYFAPTSEPIIGGLRASLIYDLPVFLSYLSIIPGMAVFWCASKPISSSTTTSSTTRCAAAARWNTSSHARRNGLSIQQGLGEIAKIQTLAVLVTFVAGPALLDVRHLPAVSATALCAGHRRRPAGGLMAILNVFFYLDQRRIVLMLCVEFVLLNICAHRFTLWFGAALYGYGFALSVLITLCTGLVHALTPAQPPRVRNVHAAISAEAC